MVEMMREPVPSPSDGGVRASGDPLRRSNLVDQIHDELHRRITDRLMPAGQRVVIDKLAAEFGVSLIPVREALARLKVERLVTHEANKGYRIAPAPEPLEMKKLFEARLIVELGALQEGFANLSDGIIAQLDAINERIREGQYGPEFASFRDFIDLNAQFHGIIVGLAENPFIDEAYRMLGYHQRVAQTLYGRGPDNLEMIVREHDAILEALRRRQLNDARAALREHIQHGLEPYLAEG
jgi:DNA-binding GntR family transcriptional regulator